MDWLDVVMFGILCVCAVSLTVQATQARKDQRRVRRNGEPVGSLWHHMMLLHKQRVADQKAKAAKPAEPSPKVFPTKLSLRTSTKTSTTRALLAGWSLGEIEFSYEDAEGEITFRRVTVHSVNALYIKGECHDRRAERTFRLDRILGNITDCDTGEILSPRAYSKSMK